MTRPLKSLITAIERVISKNYQTPIEIETDKELQVLINHFNHMQSVIHMRELELSNKNEVLKIQMAVANEANQLKSQFLANMSHELRTPLNAIIGFTNRALKKTADSLPVTQKDNLVIVKEEAEHLLDLINEILDYSKIEAGKMNLHIESFDLIKVIEESYAITKNIAFKKHLQYKQSILTPTPLPMISDRMKVRQILINLLSNAFKYSDRGTVTLSVSLERHFYRIELTDEGIGIADDQLEYIFDEFRQLDGSHTRKVGGTGLGLSITRKLISMLNGTIHVQSTQHVGSCFTVYLPVSHTVTLPI